MPCGNTCGVCLFWRRRQGTLVDAEDSAIRGIACCIRHGMGDLPVNGRDKISQNPICGSSIGMSNINSGNCLVRLYGMDLIVGVVWRISKMT